MSKKYNEAIDYYERGFKVDYDKVRAYGAMGDLYHSYVHDYQKAYGLYEKAYKFSNKDLSAKTDLVEATLTAERFTEAQTLAKEMVNEKRLNANQKLAMQIVLISSTLILGERAEASNYVKNLAEYFKSLPQTYDPVRWKFAGTKYFVSISNRLEGRDQELILGLIEVLESPKSEADRKLKKLELFYTEIFKQG